MKLAPWKSAWLLAMLVPALAFGPAALTVGNLAVSVALTVLTVVLGHTVGLHRGIIHRAFRTSEAARRVAAVLFALTGLGGPRAWLVLHAVRDHHQSTPAPPAIWRYDHGVLRDAAYALLCSPVDPEPIGVRPADLADPFLAAVDRWFVPIQLLQAAALWLAGGWDLVVVAWCARNAVVILGHWAIGYLAHTWGERRYRIDDVAEEGRNSQLLALLSFGEGFHNDHHAAPTCARFGRGAGDLDVGWLAIVALERLGVVWDVNRPATPTDFLRPGARLAADQPSRTAATTPISPSSHSPDPHSRATRNPRPSSSFRA